MAKYEHIWPPKAGCGWLNSGLFWATSVHADGEDGDPLRIRGNRQQHWGCCGLFHAGNVTAHQPSSLRDLRGGGPVHTGAAQAPRCRRRMRCARRGGSNDGKGGFNLQELGDAYRTLNQCLAA